MLTLIMDSLGFGRKKSHTCMCVPCLQGRHCGGSNCNQ